MIVDLSILICNARYLSALCFQRIQKIDSLVKNTSSVANGTVEADGINIRASKGILDIHVPHPKTVSVYSFSGLLLHSRELVAGDTRLPMPSGTFIVKVGDKVVKVMFW